MVRGTKAKRRWAAALSLLLSLVAATPAMGMLKDMAGHWAAPIVAALEAKGIVAGDDKGFFDPEAPLTRAQLSKLLVAGLGNDSEALLLARYDSRFADVAPWHWAKGYIETLAESGITDGYPDETFRPDSTVTRAQLVLFLVRAAGLESQTAQYATKETAYADDSTIPEWARGAVHVALDAGLMAGFADGTFRPVMPVSRAEAAVALFRLLGLKGSAYHLAGTLVKFDAATGAGVVRDELGQERSFAMAKDAQYYRAGVIAAVAQIRPMDQVWVVLDADNTGRFMDARYTDMLVQDLKVDGLDITASVTATTTRKLTLQPGALVFVNGKPATPGEANGANVGYMALDRQTGAVRVLDAVKAPAQGKLVGSDMTRAILYVQVGTEVRSLSVAKEAVLIVNGQPSQLSDLLVGDRLRLALDNAGTATYVLAER